MERMDAIRARRSVRTFDERKADRAVLEKIMDFARKVQNPYDISITWSLLDGKRDSLSSSVVVGTDDWIAGKMAQIPHAEEAFGYTFEKVVLYAWSLGIGTTWIAGTMDRQAFEHAMRVKEGEMMPCVSPLGYPAKKMSVRESLMRKGIRAEERAPFGELFFRGSFDTPLSPEDAGDFAVPLEMVRLGPSAVNKQPWRAVIDGNKVHFFVEHRKGYEPGKWDIQKIDMGIALCHFEIGAEESGIPVIFGIERPDLSCPDDMEYIASYTIGSRKE